MNIIWKLYAPAYLFTIKITKAMKTLYAVMSLILFQACSHQISVYTDHDPDYNIKSLTTFDWAHKTNIEVNKNPLHYNELNDKRIKTSIVNQLTRRGYSYSEGQPDFLIHYHIIVDDQSIVTTEPYGYLYGPYWMRMRTNVYSYREGTLIIDLMDPKSNNLIWRGWAVAALNGPYTTGQTEELINRAVEKIFRNFPDSNAEHPVISGLNLKGN
jgi:hypothetical protein